ncbi:MAG: hypothetical protein JWN37_849 [Candidatus Nomurabacteria bacterium]|nr:hypothetical protein [Candidatus Nomurabacteria bacterium]
MQIPSILVQKKSLILEIVGVVIVIIVGYYIYGMFSENSATTTTVAANESLLGQNITLFLKSKTQDKISFKDVSFMNSTLVKSLVDHTEIIGETASRGRLDPFVPYASSRPLR